MPQAVPMLAEIDLGVLNAEPAEEYHAKAGEYLSSHQLLDFMKCPRLHRKKTLGLVEDSRSPAYVVGEAAHVRIVEGLAAYQNRFAFGGTVHQASDIDRRVSR